MALDANNGFGGAGSLHHELDGDSLPIFDIEPVQLQFSIAADFVAAQVANNVLVLALSNGRILRIDLNKPEDIDGKPGGPFVRQAVHEMLEMQEIREIQETLTYAARARH